MKNLFIKLLLFGSVVIFLQLLIAQFTPIQRVQTIEWLDSYLASDVDVIYFGDSTLTNVSQLDINKAHTYEMLDDMVPQQVSGVPHSAYHLGLYALFADYIAAQEAQPEVVIMPINLRSFSPVWDLGPPFQFDKERLFLTENNPLWLKAFYTPLSVFGYFDPSISFQAYESSPVFDGTEQVGTVREYDQYLTGGVTDEGVRASVVYFYMAQLTPEHRKLQAMLELIETYNEQDIDVILYLTPIDYEFGEQQLGVRFNRQVLSNTAVITQMLENQDVIFLDLTFDLESEHFNWKNYPNEHLTEYGRFYVAEQLATQLSLLGFEVD